MTESEQKMSETSNHRWSGWPGAWCLDCGCEDVTDRLVCNIPIPDNHPALQPCPCPGAGKYDPYRKGESK